MLPVWLELTTQGKAPGSGRFVIPTLLYTYAVLSVFTKSMDRVEDEQWKNGFLLLGYQEVHFWNSLIGQDVSPAYILHTVNSIHRGREVSSMHSCELQPAVEDGPRHWAFFVSIYSMQSKWACCRVNLSHALRGSDQGHGEMDLTCRKLAFQVLEGPTDSLNTSAYSHI